MLTKRQLQILQEFEKHQHSYLPAEYFVNKMNVSTRTIQTDIKVIREYLEATSDAKLISVASKGRKLIILDHERFYQLINGKTEDPPDCQNDRVRKLCIILLNQNKPVSRQFLIDRLFVSTTTLSLDLKEAEKILSLYQLEIQRRPHIGIQLVGDEKEKRKCLLNLGNLEVYQNQQAIKDQVVFRQEIEKIVVGILLKHHYHISDTLFQNLIVHLEMAIKRIKNGFSIQKYRSMDSVLLSSEIDVSREIFQRLEGRFYFTSTEEEIVNFAIYIKGKSDYEEDDYISEEVNQFILHALKEIREKFDIDFTQEMELRISLALHVMPLLTRIEHDIQNENQLLDQIKQSFPLAFDIAAYMCMLLQRKIHKKIEEGEIAYLAIYYNQYLQKHNDISGKQRILIITSLKRSESVLLRQRFATWFANEISVLTLLSSYELRPEILDDYDVIFTTDQNEETERYGAILISFYPSETEYSKIKLAIDGFKDKFEITGLFSEELFEAGDYRSKEEVLQRICENSRSKIGSKVEKLIKLVNLREELGSSFFGNRIALPHPINPISTETFVSVMLLKDELEWDTDGNRVQLVMLVAIEKNNAKVFQLWNYLAKIVQDKHFVERVAQEPNFANFQKQLAELLDEYI